MVRGNSEQGCGTRLSSWSVPCQSQRSRPCNVHSSDPWLSLCHFLWKKVAKELSPSQTHGIWGTGKSLCAASTLKNSTSHSPLCWRRKHGLSSPPRRRRRRPSGLHGLKQYRAESSPLMSSKGLICPGIECSPKSPPPACDGAGTATVLSKFCENPITWHDLPGSVMRLDPKDGTSSRSGVYASQGLPVGCLAFFMPLSLEESGQRTCAITTRGTTDAGYG